MPTCVFIARRVVEVAAQGGGGGEPYTAGAKHSSATTHYSINLSES